MSGAGADEALLDDLVEQARAGSPEAFTTLWCRLSPVVGGYVRGRGVRDVDDVTSEVFLAAFEGISRFTGNGVNFRRWLFTIAHHRAVDDVRARVRRRVEEPYDPVADHRRTASAETEALTNSARDDALTLLRRLPADQQNVLLLRVVADLPVADVAVILDRSPEAVRQLQHRAISRLRREVDANKASGPITSSGLPAIAGL